jgi:hypothetical protein
VTPIDLAPAFHTVVLGAVLVASVAACDNGLGTTRTGPFDRDELVLCEPGTTSLGVFSMGGGRMRIEVVGGCGDARTCVGTDTYAPRSWATVRASGRDLSIEGCASISALAGTAVEVSFENEDGVADERYELPIRGACLDAGVMGCRATSDGGLDGGPVVVRDSGLDASTLGDAAADAP